MFYQITDEDLKRQEENREKYLESQRKEIAYYSSLPISATWEEIIKSERNKNKYIASYYLHTNESNSWKEVSNALKTLLIMEQGLPDNASWDDIIYAKCEEMDRIDQLLEEGYTWEQIRMITTEENRKKQAISLNLPENASWKDISSARRKKHLRNEAIRLDSPEDSRSYKVSKARSDEKQKDDRKIFTSCLDLPEDANWEEINKLRDEFREDEADSLDLSERSSWNEIRYSEYKEETKIRRALVKKIARTQVPNPYID